MPSPGLIKFVLIRSHALNSGRSISCSNVQTQRHLGTVDFLWLGVRLNCQGHENFRKGVSCVWGGRGGRIISQTRQHKTVMAPYFALVHRHYSSILITDYEIRYSNKGPT